jgi:hypothetical protein
MAPGEAEFAFLVAKFGLEEGLGLLEAETYASVVFAILLSTIHSPVLLRTNLALFPFDGNSSVEAEETAYNSSTARKQQRPQNSVDDLSVIANENHDQA